MKVSTQEQGALPDNYQTLNSLHRPALPRKLPEARASFMYRQRAMQQQNRSKISAKKIGFPPRNLLETTAISVKLEEASN